MKKVCLLRVIRERFQHAERMLRSDYNGVADLPLSLLEPLPIAFEVGEFRQQTAINASSGRSRLLP
jgi:hypothetical protein